MGQQAAVWLVLLVAVLAANAPYVSERFLLIGPKRVSKSTAWRLVEIALGATFTLVLGFVLEDRIGQRHGQGWEFYVAWVCMFLTLGFPGFVWRYLRRHH